MATPTSWSALAATPPPALSTALYDHFAPVLATTPEATKLLRAICARATSAKITADSPDDEYQSLDIDLGKDKLRCSLPGDIEREGMAKPPTFARIIDLHGRLTLVEAQISLFHEDYIEEEGWLDDTELEGRGVFAPMRIYADIYIYHPEDKTPSGEPALYFMDHEVVEEDGPLRVDGDVATVFLRHVSKAL